MMITMGVRIVVVGLALAAAGCKHDAKKPAFDDAPVAPGEPPPPIDAPEALACTVTAGSTVTMRHVAKVPNSAVLVTSPPGDGRLFVVEQPGTIQIVDKEVVRAQPFIDISYNSGGPVQSGGEMGLLGLAFHPQYATNRQFY